MEQIRVAIAEDNENMLDILSQWIEEDEDLELVGKAVDGEEIYNIIQDREPDIVVLDMIMPKMDGLMVMEKTLRERRGGKRPSFIVISAVCQEQMTADIFTLGADYFLLKPFDGMMLIQRIKQIRFRKEQRALYTNYVNPILPLREEIAPYKGEGLEAYVTNILHVLGVPAHIRGYQYLRDAIILSVNDLDNLKSVTKLLYPAIARKYETTPTRVERSIRHAIELAWTRGKTDIIEDIFSFTITTGKGKPTNSEFIALISDKIRLEYKKRSKSTFL